MNDTNKDVLELSTGLGKEFNVWSVNLVNIRNILRRHFENLSSMLRRPWQPKIVLHLFNIES